MEEIIEQLLTLAEDKGKIILEDNNVIKKYITANTNLLVEEIREKILTEY